MFCVNPSLELILLVGLADLELGEHQKFKSPFLLGASVVMALA
jgi:Mg2+/citrate symporter